MAPLFLEKIEFSTRAQAVGSTERSACTKLISMCLICIEFEKQRMTAKEARRAFSEMVVDLDPDHAKVVKKMLDDAETDADKS